MSNPAVESAAPLSLEEIELRLDQPLMDGGKPFPGTEGMTLREVEAEVLKGGRFLSYSWTVSVVVMSFRRSSDINFVPAAKMSGGGALGYSVMSLFLGWWGFPWGLIYTTASLVRNARGGYDHTEALLTYGVGEERAREVMMHAQPRQADVMLWGLRVGLVLLAVLLAYGIYSLSGPTTD